MRPKAKHQSEVPDTTSRLPGQDRISELPDALLSHILSFLQTIFAVRTCILSRRWKNIWKSVTSLDFDAFPDGCDPWSRVISFKPLVDHVLLFQNSLNIHKLRLSFTFGDLNNLSYIDGWIHTAMNRNVTELDLNIEMGPIEIMHFLTNDVLQFYELPTTLFMSKTLLVLKLRSNFIVNIPTSGPCFPNLKTLHVTLSNRIHDSMLKLFNICPALQDLTLDGYIEGRRLPVVVASPTVKTLRIGCDSRKGVNENYIIYCPVLENLVLSKYRLGKYFVLAKSLGRASIELGGRCSDKVPCLSGVTSLLARVSSVKSLYLSAHCFKVVSLPDFGNLCKLKLVLHKCFSWEFLMEFLNKAPHLQYLVLKHSAATRCSPRYWGQRWFAPEPVPSCLVSKLEVISIEGFKGELNTVEVVKYFLRKGEVLKMMTISSDPSCADKQALYEELLRVPRVSEA